jgi:hypothetical protein
MQGRNGVISNYAFNPIAEQALRSNQTIVPQRVNAALEFFGVAYVRRLDGLR